MADYLAAPDVKTVNAIVLTEVPHMTDEFNKPDALTWEM